MANQRKTPELAATSVEGTDKSPNAIQFNALDALRKSIWHKINRGQYQALHGALVHSAKEQGFTASQARDAINSLVSCGDAEFGIGDNGRVVVRAIRREGRS